MSYEQGRQRRRRRSAKHEAGHALVLLALGIPFKDVEIQPRDLTPTTPNFGFVLHRGELVAGLCRMDAVAWYSGRCQMNAYDQMMQAMAGAAGEQIDWKRPDFHRYDWVEAGKCDMEDAMGVAEFIWRHLSKRAVRARYVVPEFYRAVDILRQHRRAHTGLVKALMEKSLVNYAECVAIWEANRG